jgi:hypothetical protein
VCVEAAGGAELMTSSDGWVSIHGNEGIGQKKESTKKKKKKKWLYRPNKTLHKRKERA